jgi:WD40 repeat protein
MKASKFEAGRSFAESDSKHSHTPGIAKFISSVTASIIMDSEGGENSETKSKEGKGIYQKFAGYLSDVHTFALEMGSSSSSDAVALHGRSKKMAIGNSEGQILLVSTTPHEEEIIQHFDFGESVSGVCLSSDGLKVAACGAVGSVIVFDILTGCQNFCHTAPSRLMDVVFGGMDANDSSCIAFGGHAKQFELVNYSEGQRMHAFPASADVQSVSLSADGTRMAIGKTDQNGPASCKIVQTATAKVYRKWTAADMKTIYSVDLSRSGRMVAYAGYGSVVWVRSVDADELLLEHRFTQLEGSEGPTFIWSVAFSGDESRFAASCWSGEVIIWSTKTWEPICTSIKRPGVRVFSIALARDGSEILVGSRDGNAILYGLPHDDDDRRDVVILFQAVFPDRVYSVAISDRYFALAGMNSSVHLYKRLNVAKIKKDDGSVSPRPDAPAEGAAAVPIGQSARHYHHHVHFRLVHEYYVHCDQNCVEFSPDGLSLAAGGTDKSVRVWSVGDDVLDNLSLFLHRKHAIHDLSFSDSYLAFACGHKACVYGTVDARLKAHMVARPNVWSHQPSFEVLADFLRSPEALRVVKKHHPQCLNVVSPATGESILQRCVRVHNHDVLASLLDGVRRVGFIRDNEGFTALDIALKWRKRKHVETLLQAVSSGRVSTLASSLAAVSESFPKLCKTFPRLFLDFISEMPLDHVHGMSVHFSESTVVLPKGIFASYARGTRLRSEPRNLWADILKLSDGGSGRSARARLEVQAMRVPFENFVGYYPNLHESPFHLVTKVAEDLDRFEVFESPIMRAAIQFKWEQYGMQQFLWQAIKFCLNLIVLILFSVQASRSMELEDCATLDWYFGRDPESCGGNYALKQSYILLPLSFLCNKMFLTNELDQIRELGLKAYTASIWNWIDTIGFGLALAGQVMWVFAREGVKFPNSTRMCLGLSCLLMAWKMLYFLRATDQGGNLVRIVISIMDDMKPYIILLFCFVLAFAMALLIINVEAQPYILIYNAYTSNWCNEPAFSDDDDMAFDPNMFITDDQLKMCSCPPEGCTTLFLLFEYVQFVVTAAVYGSSDLFVGMGTLPTRSNQVIYNLSLVTIQIILLNLVIAVMGGTYERVQAGKVKNTLYEKAAVIVEMELSHDTSLEGIVFRKVCGPIPDLLVAIATPFLNFFQRFTSSNGETIHPGDGGEETETEAQARSSSEVRAKHLADHYPRWLHTLQKKPGNDQSTMDGDSQESSLSSSTKNGGGSSGAENTLTADMMQASLEDMGCQIQELQEAMTKLTTKSAVEFNQLRDLIQTVVIQQHTAAGLQK